MDKLKYDQGKTRLALVPSAAIKAIGEVMTHGLTKYDEGSWKKVESWRYRDAMQRHWCDYIDDPYGLDKDSGLPHLWHVVTNAAFLCELESKDLQAKIEDKQKRDERERQNVTLYGENDMMKVEIKTSFANNIDISELFKKQGKKL